MSHFLYLGPTKQSEFLVIAEENLVLTSVEVLDLLQVRLRSFGLLFSYEGLILPLPLLRN